MKFHRLTFRSLLCCLFLFAGFCSPPGSIRGAQSKKNSRRANCSGQGRRVLRSGSGYGSPRSQFEALQLYIKAFDLDPASRLLREVVASKYIETGRLKRALAVLKGKKKNPDLSADEKRLVAGIYFNLGDTLQR